MSILLLLLRIVGVGDEEEEGPESGESLWGELGEGDCGIVLLCYVIVRNMDVA